MGGDLSMILTRKPNHKTSPLIASEQVFVLNIFRERPPFVQTKRSFQLWQTKRSFQLCQKAVAHKMVPKMAPW